MVVDICITVILALIIIGITVNAVSEDIKDTKVKIRALELGIKGV